MVNNRIFYAVQQCGLAPDGSLVFTEIHGAQSVGITTNFNLDPVQEIGQNAVYENIEDIPDVELTIQKVLDGHPLIYHLATRTSTSPTLAGRANAKSIGGLAIFSDTNDSATGQPLSEVHMSGMFVSSLSYTYPVDGNFTEDVTLVGNDKLWVDSSCVGAPTTFSFLGAFNDTDVPASIDGSGGVNRREDMVMTAATGAAIDVNLSSTEIGNSVFPQDIFGVTTNGTNGSKKAHFQNVTISTDLGREAIFELGRKSPYFRFISFPVEVTCDFEVVAISGDLVSATENGCIAGGTCGVGTNLSDRTIRIVACEGTHIYLGLRNKLSNVSYGGGDTDGGNATITFSYSNFNDMTVMHTADPESALRVAVVGATHLKD